MAEWKPVVGGRAMLPSGAPCVILALGPGGLCWYACFPWSGGVQTDVHSSRLTEHPDDARHRRLLEAAREVSAARRMARKAKWQTAPDADRRLQSAIDALDAIIAECDTEEPDHA